VSETNAANSASASATSATNAASSATDAANSASSVAGTLAAVEAVYDQFDDRYLGPKASDPTLDNDGNPLVQGTLYFSTAENVMKVYDGANWDAATSAGGASLLNYNFTATAGQTAFSGADDNSQTLSYAQNNLIVTLNGITLEDGTDYTATDGVTITLTSAAAAGDELNVVAFKTFAVADAYTKAEADAEFLNQTNGDARYVNKSGDTMTGSLTLATAGFSGGLQSTATTGDTSTRWRLSRNTSTGQLGKDWFLSVNTDTGSFAIHESGVADRFSIDTSGRITTPYQPAFLTRTHGSNHTGGWAKFTGFTTDTYNIGGHWSLASQRFTAPITGIYTFYVGGWMNGNAADTRFGYNFQVNGGAQTYICGGNESAGDTPIPAGFVVLNLSANDYVDLTLFLAGGTRQMGTTSHSFYYGGYLIG
jgi:hypothetical protein